MIGGRGLSRRLEFTPETDECRPVGEIPGLRLLVELSLISTSSNSSEFCDGDSLAGCGSDGVSCGKRGNHASFEPLSKSLLPKFGDTSKLSLNSGDSLYTDGEVRAVSAVELGADIYGSCINKSCGDTVPMLVVELEELALKSRPVGRAGEEYAVVDAPTSMPAKSSKSRSLISMLAGVCGKLPVPLVNNRTGGRATPPCRPKDADDDGADDA